MTRALVSCAGCTACCRHDAILLFPGDDHAKYETVPFVSPVTGKRSRMIAKAANGDCIYLDRATGCTIWEDAPIVCRTFDCADFYARFGAARIRREIAAGNASQEVADAGRKRLKSRREQ